MESDAMALFACEDGAARKGGDGRGGERKRGGRRRQLVLLCGMQKTCTMGFVNMRSWVKYDKETRKKKRLNEKTQRASVVWIVWSMRGGKRRAKGEEKERRGESDVREGCRRERRGEMCATRCEKKKNVCRETTSKREMHK